MQNRNFLNFPRLLELKKQRRRVFRTRILIYIFISLLFLALLVYISRAQSLNISGVEIIGTKVIDAETIKEIVLKDIDGNYLWLFPRKNVLLYPKKNITNELLGKFNRIRSISFLLKDKKVLEVSISERVASYIWCGAVLPETRQAATDKAVSGPNTDAGQKCYFLDGEGYFFDEAAYFSEDVYFKFYGAANLSDGIPIGSSFSPDIFGKLISFKESLQNMELKPVAAYIPGNGEIKFFLSGETAQSMGPEIIFNVDSDFHNIEENLETALDTEPLRSNFKNKYSSLLYIDLRFKNKVYYKFK